jgi:Probable transposase
VLFVAGGGARWEPADGDRWADAIFQAVGRVKVHQHRPVVGRGTTLQLKWIAGLQRRKERGRPGSGNRRRLRRALAKGWRTLRDRRRDFHHKTARGLVDSCDTLALEPLRVAAMIATAAGMVEAQGRNVAAKAGLNRSILDADLNGARNIATRAGLGWAGLWSALRGLRSCRRQPTEQ